MLSEEVEE